MQKQQPNSVSAQVLSDGNPVRMISSDALFSAMERQFAENRRVIFTVTGMSMWPFLCGGRDRVLLTRCDPAKLRRGDVVLLQTPPGTYMLHRVTALKTDCFETTGDGNCFRDGFFPLSCIRAQMAGCIRKGKPVSCDARSWRIVSAVWTRLYPVRRYLLRMLRALGAIRAKLK